MRRKKGKTEENGLNEMRHSLFPEYYKVYREDSRRNDGGRVILSVLFISAAFSGHDELSSELVRCCVSKSELFVLEEGV